MQVYLLLYLEQIDDAAMLLCCPLLLPALYVMCTTMLLVRFDPPDGGTDVLPRTIQTELAHNPAATVLVSQSSDSQGVDGVGG
jgi:hypothetical protein